MALFEELLDKLAKDADISEGELREGVGQLIGGLPNGKITADELSGEVEKLSLRGGNWPKLVAQLRPKLQKLRGPLGFLAMATVNSELEELRKHRSGI